MPLKPSKSIYTWVSRMDEENIVEPMRTKKKKRPFISQRTLPAWARTRFILLYVHNDQVRGSQKYWKHLNKWVWRGFQFPVISSFVQRPSKLGPGEQGEPLYSLVGLNGYI